MGKSSVTVASPVARLHKLANSVRINLPYTASDVRQYKSRCARTELEIWNGRTSKFSKGLSLPPRVTRWGTQFCGNHPFQKHCRFIYALQLRTFTAAAGNRTLLNRARPSPADNLSCRTCGEDDLFLQSSYIYYY